MVYAPTEKESDSRSWCGSSLKSSEAQDPAILGRWLRPSRPQYNYWRFQPHSQDLGISGTGHNSFPRSPTKPHPLTMPIFQRQEDSLEKGVFQLCISPRVLLPREKMRIYIWYAISSLSYMAYDPMPIELYTYMYIYALLCLEGYLPVH